MTKHEKMLLDIAKEHHHNYSQDKFNSWLFGFYKINTNISDKLKRELKQLKENGSGGS